MNEHPMSVEIRRLEAEIERLKEENYKLRTEIAALVSEEDSMNYEFGKLKALLIRAVEALEQHQMVKGDGTITGEVSDLMLIDELRKAAE